VLSWIEEQDAAMARLEVDISLEHGFEQPGEGRERSSKRVRLHKDTAAAQPNGVPASAAGLPAERRPPVGPPVKGVTK